MKTKISQQPHLCRLECNYENVPSIPVGAIYCNTKWQKWSEHLIYFLNEYNYNYNTLELKARHIQNCVKKFTTLRMITKNVSKTRKVSSLYMYVRTVNLKALSQIYPNFLNTVQFVTTVYNVLYTIEEYR